jgi:hypothetical protein
MHGRLAVRLLLAVGAAAALFLPSAGAAAAVVEPAPSAGCGIHIAGHPGVSLELLGTSFTPSSPVRVDWTVDGANPQTTSVVTDSGGSFDLTIATAPTHMGVYDFVITDPRCTLMPSAIAVPAPALTEAPSVSPAITTPPTDAVGHSAEPASDPTPLVPTIAILALTAATSVLLLRRPRRR